MTENINEPKLVKLFYRAKEIAYICGIGRTSLYRYIKQGLLPPPTKLNKTSLWKAEDVETFFKKLENGELGKGEKKE